LKVKPTCGHLSYRAASAAALLCSPARHSVHCGPGMQARSTEFNHRWRRGYLNGGPPCPHLSPAQLPTLSDSSGAASGVFLTGDSRQSRICGDECLKVEAIPVYSPRRSGSICDQREGELTRAGDWYLPPPPDLTATEARNKVTRRPVTAAPLYLEPYGGLFSRTRASPRSRGPFPNNGRIPGIRLDPRSPQSLAP